MTLPELKIAVYLLPEVAWPIIKQSVANTGDRLQCFVKFRQNIPGIMTNESMSANFDI